MNKSVAWLHLSDWHQKGKEYDREVVRKALLKDIEKRMEIDRSLEKIDFIVFSGDVAQNGKKEEYDAAIEQFFDRVLAATGLAAQQLFIIPGNHDIDRDWFKYLPAPIKAPFTRKDEVFEWLADDIGLKKMLEPFDKFSEFVKDYTRQSCPVYADARILDTQSGIKVALAGLNSALMCSRNKNAKDEIDDRNHLIIGEPQVIKAIEAIENERIRIAVLHHPFDWLAEFDRISVEREMMSHFHFILHGHTHKPEADKISGMKGDFVIIPAGTCYDRRISSDPHYINAYNFTRIDLLEGKGKVFLRQWNEVERKWAPQEGTKHRGGIFPFDLPKELTTDDSGSSGQYTPSADPKLYLTALLDECKSIEIRGLKVSDANAHRLDIEKLYTPLYVTGGSEEMSDASGDKESLGRHMREKTSLDEVLKHPAALIIGDPGSGKSTFLKRIATILCRSHLKQGAADSSAKLGLDPAPYPLLVRLFDLAKHINRCRANNEAGCPAGDDSSAWLFHYLDRESNDRQWGLPREWFERQCANDNGAIVLLDGLDEAPDAQSRNSMVRLANKLRIDCARCRIVVTSRPAAYEDEKSMPLNGFSRCDIALLDDEGVKTFLRQWCGALYFDTPERAKNHLDILQHDVFARAAIRRMAANPVMLTALAVVHWNNKRLPEQRAELYESVIDWLLDSRSMKYAGSARREECFELLKTIALAMQAWPQGRQKSLELGELIDLLAPKMKDNEEKKRRSLAERFIENEELDSGIIRARGYSVEFWHLTFMEYLAARELAGMGEESQRKILLQKEIIDDPNWRETLLLFIGILWAQGRKKVEGFFRAMLDAMELLCQSKAPEEVLSREARCFGLMGAMLRDLQPYDYKVEDPRFAKLQVRVEQIFDPGKAVAIPIAIRVTAAEALGQAGDHRIMDDLRTEESRNKMFIDIPEGAFLMGAQKNSRKGENYDKEAYDDEAPVHMVHLSAFKICRYSVTVSQFELFVNEDGYKRNEFWKAGREEGQEKPAEWEQQLAFPNRPVVGVSWYEAMAFCAWADLRLPTEAQWERAARGPRREFRKYPWGNEEIDIQRANFDETKIQHASPVGCFPSGNVTWDSGKELWLADMAGNVWEWCGDWLGEYKADAEIDPAGQTSGSLRVLRGGSWIFVSRLCRCAFRFGFDPGFRYVNAGFRVVFVPQFAAAHSDLPMSKRSEALDRS